MNKSRDCEEFLNKMLKLARNGIIIDKKMVYGNLIRLGITESGNVSAYFNYWQDKFADVFNISVFVADYWKYFCQFINDNVNRNNFPLKKKNKLYISLDLDHIKDGANKIFLFLAKENIAHISKISSNVRIDDIVIRIDNMDVASQIEAIICNDKFLLSGLMRCNPFAFNDGIISYAWDGDLSYHSIVSSIIANYVNEIKDIKEYITYDDFLKYVDKIYNDTFIEGKNIDNFKLKMNVESNNCNEDDVLVNLAGIIKILLANLKHNSKIDDFYLNYKIVTSDEYYKEIVKVLHKDDNKSKYYVPAVYDNSISQDLIDLWDKNYLFMIEKYHGLENALNYIQKFLETGDYSSFTRDYGISVSMIEKKDYTTSTC